MARFNANSGVTRAKKTGGNTVNYAGGQAHSLSNKEELVSILLTSFVADQYYRSAGDVINKLIDLIETGDKLFAAKAAIYARNEFGMRSVSHVVAGEIARLVKGESWTSDFFNSVVRRPDDMLEIMSYFADRYATKKKVARKRGECDVIRSIPNSLKRGLRNAFGKFDSYQLAKYRGENKDISMIDLVRLLHPAATERNGEALAMLVNGNLKSNDTWETMLTQAGQQAENEDHLAELKATAWETLIKERKLGYFALLRNIRNIIQQAPHLVHEASKMLVDEKLIHKSLVLPFRFFQAYREVENMASKDMLSAISNALLISCDNLPRFDGKTLVVLDDSGSMVGTRLGGSRSTMDPATAGALMSALLMKVNPSADFMMFNTRARYVHIDRDANIMKQVEDIVYQFESAGTDLKCIFKTAKKSYDRVVIFSDMQGWVGYYSPSAKGGPFDTYRKKFNCDPYVYSIDLAGYGTSQFDPTNSKVFMMAGFSEKLFDIMKLLETDRSAMVSQIESVQFDA